VRIGSADKYKFKKSLKQFIPQPKAEIRGLHPGQVNVGYFLAWFQSLQLTSSQPERPLALIPLARKSHVSFKVCPHLWKHNGSLKVAVQRPDLMAHSSYIHTYIHTYILNCEQNFSFSILRSGLSDIRFKCNRISEGLLYC
jgi:hypothetical protein